MKRCRFCQRILRSEKAVRLGVGSGCARKFRGFRASKKSESEGQLSLFPRKPWAYKKATRRGLDSR